MKKKGKKSFGGFIKCNYIVYTLFCIITVKYNLNNLFGFKGNYGHQDRSECLSQCIIVICYDAINIRHIAKLGNTLFWTKHAIYYNIVKCKISRD